MAAERGRDAMRALQGVLDALFPEGSTGRSRPASHCSKCGGGRRSTLARLALMRPCRPGVEKRRLARRVLCARNRSTNTRRGPVCRRARLLGTDRASAARRKHSKKFPRYAAEVSRGSARTFSRASRFPVRALNWVWPCQPMTTGRCLLRAHHLGTGLMRLARSRNTSI